MRMTKCGWKIANDTMQMIKSLWEKLTYDGIKGPFSSEILCAPGSFFIYEKYAIFFEVVESLLYLLQSSLLVLSKFHQESCESNKLS